MATQREHVGDLVVVVPGILGSRLADAERKEVWGSRAAHCYEASGLSESRSPA